MAIPRPKWADMGSPVPLGILKCHICRKPVVKHPSVFEPCTLFTGYRLVTTGSLRNASRRQPHPADTPSIASQLRRRQRSDS